MLQNRVSAQQCLPFIIGITGHRDLNDDNGNPLDTNLRASVRKTFEYWRHKMGEDTPIWLLNGLAAGADLLVAEVGLELQQEWGFDSLRIIACLPMPLTYYAEDFKDLTGDGSALLTLNQIIEQLSTSHNEVLIIDNALSDTDEKIAFCDTDYGPLRNSLYINQGLFIAKYSNVLMSLWDGKQANGLGGTADITYYKLGGKIVWPAGCENPALQPISDFDGQTAGLVHHIPTKRAKNEPHQATSELEQARWFTSLAQAQSEQPAIGTLYACLSNQSPGDLHVNHYLCKEFERLVDELSIFNAQAAKFQDEINPVTDAGLNTSNNMFVVADALALSWQLQYRKVVRTFFMLAIPGLACYELAGNLVNSAIGSVVIFATLIAIVGCWWLIKYAAKNDFKWKYQLARGVAEGMRIRGFLNLANVPPSPAPLIPRRFRNHLPLLNHSVSIAEMDWWRGDLTFSKPLIEKIWLDDQRGFLKSRLSSTSSSYKDFLYKRPQLAANRTASWAKRSFRLATIFGSLLFGLMVTQQMMKLDLFSEFNNWLMLALQYSLMLGGLAALWSELSGYESTANGYGSLDELYNRAQTLIGTEASESQQQMLLDLAREAMFEHVSWSHSEMNNDIKQRN